MCPLDGDAREPASKIHSPREEGISYTGIPHREIHLEVYRRTRLKNAREKNRRVDGIVTSVDLRRKILTRVLSI